MKPTTPASMLMIVLLFVGLLGSGAGAASGPRATVAEPVKDVGEVAKGEKIVHQFKVRNQGDEVLEITQVKPSCGCTVAEYDRTIAPGKEGSVQAVIDTKTFKGPIAKSVRVFTSDPNNPQLNLVVKANIVSPVDADPGYSRFVTVYGESAESSIQTVWSSQKPDLVVSKVESPLPFLAASFREAAEGEGREGFEGRQWLIEVTLAADAPPGGIADYVVVHTNHPKQRTLRIPVSGYVRPILTVTPRIADFGRRQITEPQTASLEIKNLSAEPVALTEVTSTLEGLDAAIEPVEEGRVFKVVLTLQPGMTKGPFEGSLTITTSSPKQPVLEVSVKGMAL